MFALIINGTVVQTAAAEFPVNPALTWVDISTVSPAPQPGWTYSGGTFAAPVVPPLPAQTLAQQAEALLAGGLAISSASGAVPAATYATDAHSAQKYLGLQATTGKLETFAGGATTWPLKNIANPAVPVIVTVAQFAILAPLLDQFISGADLVIDGFATALPPAAVTIA